jgi:aryl-alcohol dehydrogenase-like predicted oxidoreductase
MNHANIPHLEKPVSRLVMGVDNQTELEPARVVFDDFVARGGNCFDTAFVYGAGVCETVFGQWLETQNRDQVVIIGKGAHTPYCTPEHLTQQLMTSLERLQTDFVDIYMMHRDNTDLPVSAFVDVLNDHLRAGRIKTFGGSNWSVARVQEANDYAASKGLQGFSVVSNNFSLARMVDPPWAGCISASDADSRDWFTKNQITLLPWSSQARGFFVRGNQDFLEDTELVRCWYAPDNFQRLARAQELAGEKGCDPIQIALAYVLWQPFPTIPLIGPRNTAETASSFKALELELTPLEVKWLNLESETRI